MEPLPRLALGSVVLLAALGSAACESTDPAGGDAVPAAGAEASTPAGGTGAAPAAPAYDGRLPVRLATGERVYTPLRCDEPEPGQVCTTDGDTYALLGAGHDATLLAAVAGLNAGHTAWHAEFQFAPGSARALVDAVAAVRATGADLLLQVADGPALVVHPLPDVRGDALVVGDLEKPDAWSLVAPLSGG